MFLQCHTCLIKLFILKLIGLFLKLKFHSIELKRKFYICVMGCSAINLFVTFTHLILQWNIKFFLANFGHLEIYRNGKQNVNLWWTSERFWEFVSSWIELSTDAKAEQNFPKISWLKKFFSLMPSFCVYENIYSFYQDLSFLKSTYGVKLLTKLTESCFFLKIVTRFSSSHRKKHLIVA